MNIVRVPTESNPIQMALGVTSDYVTLVRAKSLRQEDPVYIVSDRRV